ncbi:MAG: polysaccharide deacetylase family protein [Terrimicrobiaceae bacterium]|nr:polysaccharide deacetylase family protein [Terrimicrobiaceae bacterium]
MQKAHQEHGWTFGPGRPALVVSIHDVSPLTRERTANILADLAAVGVRRTSLLVVPDHHRRGRISEDEPFGTWLRGQVASGHEAVLHGFFHLRERRPAEGPWERFVTGTYTAGEGEFFDLPADAARERLEAGRAELAACGVTATGFIAPAWLLGNEAESAVRAAGFDYTTRIATVSDFRSGVVHRSRSLCWSVRAAWRRVCSLGWNRLVLGRERNRPLVRIGIHPPDWDHVAIRRQILTLTRAALASREAIPYDTWLSSVRTAP